MFQTCRYSLAILLLSLAAFASTGWTTISADPTSGTGTKYIYVSNTTGSNSYDGLYPDHSGGGSQGPKMTIAAGKALMTNGHADWLELKCGETWSLESFASWDLSGKATGSREKMRIMSYGTGARPIISCDGTSPGFSEAANTTIRDLAITDIAFTTASHAVPNVNPNGISFEYSSENILIEGCYVEKFYNNVIFNANSNSNLHTNAAIRRNVLVDSYSNSGTYPYGVGGTGTDNGNSQGIYCSGVVGLTIEENYLLNNGFPAAPTVYNNGKSHNAYIQWGSAAGAKCTSVVFSRNFATDSDGVQLRGGGTAEYNVFSQNCEALGLGTGLGYVYSIPGISFSVTHNCVLESKTTTTPWGSLANAVAITNVGAESYFDYNILAGTDNIDAHAFNLVSSGSTGAGVPCFPVLAGILRSRHNVFYYAGDVNARDYGTTQDDCEGPEQYTSKWEWSNNDFMHWNSQYSYQRQFWCESTRSGSLLDGEYNWFQIDNTYFTQSDWFREGSTNYPATGAGNFPTHVGWTNTSIGRPSGWPSDITTTSTPYNDGAAPNRATLANYWSEVSNAGWKTHADFTTACRAQSRQSWDSNLEAENVYNYIADCFGK